jgi:hypothetical protein
MATAGQSDLRCLFNLCIWMGFPILHRNKRAMVVASAAPCPATPQLSDVISMSTPLSQPCLTIEHRHRYSPESQAFVSIHHFSPTDSHHYQNDNSYILCSVHFPFSVYLFIFYVIARFSLSCSVEAYVLYSIMYEHTADQLREATGSLSGKLPAPAHTMRSTSYNASIASRRSVAPMSRLLLDTNTGAYNPGLASG